MEGEEDEVDPWGPLVCNREGADLKDGGKSEGLTVTLDLHAGDKGRFEGYEDFFGGFWYVRRGYLPFWTPRRNLQGLH